MIRRAIPVLLTAGLAPLAHAEYSLLAADEKPPLPAEDHSFLQYWTGSIEGGLNGSTGNTDNVSARAAILGARETDRNVTKAGLSYVYANQEGEKTKSRGELFARNDFKLEPGSPWRIFAEAKLEYDEFQDWDMRVSAFAGVGYAFIEDDTTTIVGRIGPGFSRTIGGTDDEWRAELVIGADLSHKLSERSKITASVDYFPSLSDFPGEYRIVAKAGYEVLVDPETKMSFKIGAEDRYDSRPGDGVKKNDLDYYALLVWSF